jgi:hypothetical protein
MTDKQVGPGNKSQPKPLWMEMLEHNDAVESTMVTETEKLFYRTLSAIILETTEDKRVNKRLIHTMARSAIDHYIIATSAKRAGENRK